jgi:hypothetical protein
MLGLAAKLSKLLSDDNVRYLDVLLSALTEPQGSPVYNALWDWFAKQFPHPDAKVFAWRALKTLHNIVREYRTRKGI